MSQELKSKTILIVDDDAPLRKSLSEALGNEGYLILQAANGQEALNILREGAPVRLVLLDMTMPVLNGWQFLDQLRDHLPELFASIPVVILSAADEIPGVAIKMASRHLKKPVDLNLLLTAVFEACGRPELP